jgi:hypothetical protein
MSLTVATLISDVISSAGCLRLISPHPLVSLNAHFSSGNTNEQLTTISSAIRRDKDAFAS